ncbi:hypothetical protein [Mucilaginibacter xinganensis]|uniref:Uncharacterized protein n=1 Tax=Mucilaginibacter xinganensis TaxID=1234841 RepID=A0A223NU27_9SPHI|nr:hypothetical protein [Mucilaginibacter xinganensis]ASU33011.1 hypothetical protein MuYL_1111 [Mucilaginibacter xinganensis]
MSQVREIKCPHCGEWTLWAGGIDDRCLYCDGFLETRRFSREVEKKVRAEVIKENDYFFINPNDSALKKNAKKILNSLRWWTFYLQIAFFVFVTLILVIISFLPA